MKREHFNVIAVPLDRFAIRRNGKVDHIVEWPGRRMFAGYPLWIKKRKRPRMDADRLLYMKDIPRRLAGVNFELDRRILARSGRRAQYQQGNEKHDMLSVD